MRRWIFIGGLIALLVGLFAVSQDAAYVHFKAPRIELLISPAHAQFNGCQAGFCNPAAASAPTSSWCTLIPAQSNLVNCWPFDTAHTTFNGSGSGNATDLKGGFNAALTNVSANGSGPSTNCNNGGVFDGSTSIGATTGLTSFITGSAWTLNVWLNSTVSGGQKRVWANDHTDSDNNGFEIEVQPSGDSTALIPGNGSTTGSIGFLNTGGVWQMNTFTFSGTTLTSYLNGSSANTSSFTGPVTAGSNSVAFGYNPAYSGDYYSGAIACAAVWNTALTSGQITTLYGL